MKTLILFAFLFLLLTSLLSCNDTPNKPFHLPKNSIELLSGTHGKTWELAKRLNGDTGMNMGDCFLSYRITYHPNKTLHDNNGDHYDCGETLKATWEFFKNKEAHNFIKIESKQLPKLMHMEAHHKYFQLLDLTDSTLTVTFKHQQFSNQTRWITDYLVPEDVVVQDRDFHNR